MDRQTEPYVLHIKDAPTSRHKTVGAAVGTIVKRIKKHRDWARTYSPDQMLDIMTCQDGVSALKQLNVGQVYTDECVIDGRSNSKLTFTIFHDDGVAPGGQQGLL